jgi:D-alanyl-D-alanine carboxypeptidase/D-alanyl-D-alanine-endopeptidase (penicillin-binding protein 4)
LRLSYGQETAVTKFLSDSAMLHASASILVRDAATGEAVIDINKSTSLTPASVLKLITSGVALEVLGPEHKFRTVLAYTGRLDKKSGKLNGDIIIKGGGDPALGSEYFAGHYKNFPDSWVSSIKNLGIKEIEGRVITDDTYFDNLPAPAKWQWEDLGNYYGAGVFGLNVFDNMVRIHFRTSDEGSPAIISGTDPSSYICKFANMVTSSGNSDNGYIFSSPYSDHGWITGTIPVNREDFVLKGAVADPPMLFARLFSDKLKAAGINISGKPATCHSDGTKSPDKIVFISELLSPDLSRIIEILNHESVNLFAETLLKELGKQATDTGSTSAGLKVVYDFLNSCNISTGGIFLEDGSGLSPRDAITTEALTSFLIYMKNKGKYFSYYAESLPLAGKEGTLTAVFRDPAFEYRLRAKSGSMERVRCYAGYFTTVSGKEMTFSILTNNFTGPSSNIIHLIEEVVREIISNK